MPQKHLVIALQIDGGLILSGWEFCAAYLDERFGEEWCLSPEQSLSLHAGNRTVPAQLMVRTPRGGNKPTPLPHGTSVFDARNAMPAEHLVAKRDGLRLYSLAQSYRISRSANSIASTGQNRRGRGRKT